MIDLISHLEATESFLGYRFKNRDLLLEALTHSSFSNELSQNATDTIQKLPNNERLEFLGDAVIGLVVAQKLMEMMPDASEGKLSRLRSHLVSRKTLAVIAQQFKMGDYMLLGRGEKRTGGSEKTSILAAAVESMIGALYLDAGLEVSSHFILRLYAENLSELVNGNFESMDRYDCKTLLQEKTQVRFRTTPVYRLVEAWGAEHEKQFRVEILIHGNVMASGDGKSKKEAEQAAASFALVTLEQEIVEAVAEVLPRGLNDEQ